MADDKKDKKSAPSDAGPLGASNVWEFLVIAGVLIALLSYAVLNFFGFLQSSNPLDDSGWFEHLSKWFWRTLPIFKIISFFVSVFLVYMIVSVYRKMSKLSKQIKAKYAKPAGAITESKDSNASVMSTPVSVQNKRWERVLEHIESTNPNDWKIAIIESDSILDEMTKSMGYHGDNLGERLKGIEVSDFNTLNNAWEAHKVRNMIAHEGANFELNEREARRVIALYKSVFEEFKYI
ncbi:MAG: hypothetical protein U0522_00330 [Candidatus Paceibacterota bacterium]